jgi:hypothetical protein
MLLLVLAITPIAKAHALTVIVSSTSEQVVLYNRPVNNTGWYISGTSINFTSPTTKVTYRPYSSGDLNIRVSNAKTFTATMISGGQSYWGILNANSITHVDLHANIDVAGGVTHKGSFTF